jgi:MFS family permease
VSTLGLSYAIWIVAGTNYVLLIAFAVLLGVADGAIIALSPAVVTQQFGTVAMGGVLGALYTANGFGGLIGPPVMGRIIDSSGHTAAH